MSYQVRAGKECIAMLLAGGQGSRLRMLTKNLAKPAVPFGGQYRIIDFSLSNCANSGIDTVGVLTQYKPLLLNSYVGIGSTWDLYCHNGGATILPPYVSENGGHWYKGTAHAVYENIEFILKHKPEHVLILSGDHIYKMDYSKLLSYHKEKNADLTIAAIQVPWDEACRFGILKINENGEITEFIEKPANPPSNLASMGVYVFKTGALIATLKKDANDPLSENDFGKNVIPRMLQEGQKLYAYPFSGYWKDVGTIDSYWLASMDMLEDNGPLDLFDKEWAIYSLDRQYPPHYLAGCAKVKKSMISEGCMIWGEVENSIIFPGVVISREVKIKDSIIMSNVRIETSCKIEKAIIGENTVIGEGSIIGGDFSGEEYAEILFPKITVVEDNLNLPPHSKRAESPLSEAAVK